MTSGTCHLFPREQKLKKETPHQIQQAMPRWPTTITLNLMPSDRGPPAKEDFPHFLVILCNIHIEDHFQSPV